MRWPAPLKRTPDRQSERLEPSPGSTAFYSFPVSNFRSEQYSSHSLAALELQAAIASLHRQRPSAAAINGSGESNSNMDLRQPTAKVLVVEDEMMLRMRAVDIVEDAGFTPLEAAVSYTHLRAHETDSYL